MKVILIHKDTCLNSKNFFLKKALQKLKEKKNIKRMWPMIVMSDGVAVSCMVGAQVPVALTHHRMWMLKGDGCSYYTGALKSYKSLEAAQVPPVYDIEDMINVGSRRKFCPYFTLRNLLYASEIVFCPYNYLIDPSIRESVSIGLFLCLVCTI